MGDEERRRLVMEAYHQIVERGTAVCICGQTFLTEDGYASHVPNCVHVKRQRAVSK